MSAEMILIEVNGKQHHFSEENLRWMIGTGWIFYLTSLIGTYIYYKIHPSFTDIREAFIVKNITLALEVAKIILGLGLLGSFKMKA